MNSQVTEFNDYRIRMNERLLDGGSNMLKRIFSFDKQAYQEGELNVATKELLGLVASAVLRCDDCVKYHLENCFKEKLSKTAVVEAHEIATLVGGTIVIPHLRKAYEFWEALESNTKS